MKGANLLLTEKLTRKLIFHDSGQLRRKKSRFAAVADFARETGRGCGKKADPFGDFPPTSALNYLIVFNGILIRHPHMLPRCFTGVWDSAGMGSCVENTVGS